MNRTAVKTHADQFWFRPCQDGQVWLNNAPINIPGEMSRRGLSPSDWAAVFLNYDTSRYVDGLYFIRSAATRLS